MMRPVVVFYISGHGFGHASRNIEIIDALLDLRPEVRCVIRTAAKRWLFDLTLRHEVELQPFEADTGVVQIDSLSLDEGETIRRAADFYRDLEARVNAEADVLRSLGASLVVADIPPLGLAAAAAAGIDAAAVGNFTWDWIYEGYQSHLGAAPDLVATLGRIYAQTPLVLRLPMWGGFASVPPDRIVEVPLVARRSRQTRGDVRRALGLPTDRRLVLLSFGGFGLKGFDLAALARLPGYAIVSTGQVGARAEGGGSTGGIIELDEGRLYRSGYRYEDLVGACEVVATKPGYGIIAESAANGAALLYTSRGHFVEYDVLVRAMPGLLRSRFIPPSDFREGRWAPYLDSLLADPAPPRPRVDGAEVVARHLVDRLDERR